MERLKAEGDYRVIPAGRADGSTDFTTNDYLGLAATGTLMEEFLANGLGNDCAPMTSSASRLLCGRQEEYRKLEQLLERLYGRAALVFNSGYHANTGMISALGSLPSTLIVADKLAHASIIDGMKLADAPSRRFAHNKFSHLEQILEKECRNYDNIVVAVESVYSMDGDSTDLDALTDLRRHYPQVILYVDEAHAVGVCGEGGLGMCRSHPRYGEIDIIVGTLGKALASSGAYCVCSEAVKQFAVNRCRSLIFSTALPPVCCRWSRFVIEKAVGMDSRRAHLRRLSRLLAEETKRPEASHIVPVIAGSSAKALEWSATLLDRGMKVLPIRRPTVPPGTERLRISLSAALDDDDVKRLGEAIRNLR